MRRFFSSSPLPEVGDDLLLPGSETHHLRDTLRLQTGDRCLITDGLGREAEARIRRFSEKGETLLTVVGIRRRMTPASSKTRPSLRVAIAMPQKGKLDFLMGKAQELGVQEIWPLETERTMVKMTAESKAKALARWQRIAAEAVKQSGAPKLVSITLPKTFRRAIQEIPREEPIVIFHPDLQATLFREWVGRLLSSPNVFIGDPRLKSATKLGGSAAKFGGHAGLTCAEKGSGPFNLFFGPEGGFSDKEIEWTHRYRKEQGAEPPCLVSLGENILKVDTAFLGVMAALRLLFL